MRPENVHTIQQFITYCREVLAQHPEQMSDQEQQSSAGALVGLYICDEYHREWEKKYPQVVEILDVASDLDWLNTDSARNDWLRIKRLVDELERQVTHKAP